MKYRKIKNVERKAGFLSEEASVYQSMSLKLKLGSDG